MPRYFRRTFISHLSERLKLSKIESIYCIQFLLLGYVTTSYFDIFSYGSIVITKFLQEAPLFKRSSSNIPLHELVWLLLADHMTIKNLLIPVLDGLQPLNLKFEFSVWRYVFKVVHWQWNCDVATGVGQIYLILLLRDYKHQNWTEDSMFEWDTTGHFPTGGGEVMTILSCERDKSLYFNLRRCMMIWIVCGCWFLTTSKAFGNKFIGHSLADTGVLLTTWARDFDKCCYLFWRQCL